jgi:hypothetical protein
MALLRSLSLRTVRPRARAAGRRRRLPYLESLEERLVLSSRKLVFDPALPVQAGAPGRVIPLDSGGATRFTAAADNLAYGGGPLIQNVQVEPIFIEDGSTGSEVSPAFQAGLDAYFSAVTTDAYIPSQLAQYSVPANFHGLGNPAYTTGTGGKGADDANVVFTPTETDLGYPAIDDSQIPGIIQGEINAQRTTAPTANTLYVVFTPPGDAVTAGNADSIFSFLGYHTAYFNGVQDVYYAVIPDESAAPNASEGFAPLQGEEVVSSHEMSEAITDPLPASGWVNSASGEEVGDQAANESYTLDGNQVQYEWSNALVGPAHAPGTSGQPNLFINQLSPPAVSSFTGGPIATFTAPGIVNNPAAFTAYAFTYSTSGAVTSWTASVSGGADGVYVVNASPPSALATGQVGSFGTQTGLYVYVYQGSNVPLDAATSDPVAVRYQPFKVGLTAPLTYYADNGLMSADGNLAHNFRLVKSGTAFNLLDNGQLVFSQPAGQTTTIKIAADPNGVDSSLAIDFNGGTYANAVTFSGGTGTGAHTLTGPNTRNLWTLTGPGAGKLNKATFSNVTNLVGGPNVDVFKFSGSGGISGTIQGGGAPSHQGDWLDYSSVTYAVTVNLAAGTATNTGGVSGIQDVHGGNFGNTLTGSSQGNILIGGTGADTITGGSGASILIGDKGADQVLGGSGGDILIGDYTTYDTMSTAHENSLMAILAEWQSGDSYFTRFTDIDTGTGGGLNGANKLRFGSTVLSDGSADTLTAAASGSALDWYFQGTGDTITPSTFEAGEHINNT